MSDSVVIACRHAMHRVRAHQYATAVLRGEMSVEDARMHYERAMANHDQIIQAALNGKPQDANIAAMERGAAAIDDLLESRVG